MGSKAEKWAVKVIAWEKRGCIRGREIPRYTGLEIGWREESNSRPVRPFSEEFEASPLDHPDNLT